VSLPFTIAEFLDVFAAYNRAIWPAQVLMYAIGVLLAVTGYLRAGRGTRLIALGLALLWAWMGGVYHLLFFRQINPAAAIFGVGFLVQAVLFAAWGLTLRPEAASRMNGARAWAGGTVLAYALVGYPVVGWALGHRYPWSPTFGVPCPTTIATFGLFLWITPRPPWWLLVVPLVWVLIGTSAALLLGIGEDYGLLAAGVASLWYRLATRLRTQKDQAMHL
jgi:hypothetical protein